MEAEIGIRFFFLCHYLCDEGLLQVTRSDSRSFTAFTAERKTWICGVVESESLRNEY